MSLATQVAAGFTRVAQEVKAVRGLVQSPITVAQREGVLGARFAVAGSTHWVPTVSARNVLISAGTGIICGTVDSTSSQSSIAIPANTSSTQIRYDLIVRRVVWSSSGYTATFQRIAGTLGAAPPTTRSLIAGGTYDGLIAIVTNPVNSGNPSIVDARVWGSGNGPLVRAANTYLSYTDALPGTEVLVLNNAGLGWQRYVFDGAGNWRATREITLQGPSTDPTLTSANGQNYVTLASVAIPDLGYPYEAEPRGQVGVAANTGTAARLYARLDNANGTIISSEAIRSGLLPDGEIVTLAIEPFKASALTGPRTIVLAVQRMMGTGNVAIIGGHLNVLIRPSV